MKTLPMATKTVQLKLVYLLLGAGVLFGVGGAVGGGIATVAMKVISRKVDAVATTKPKYTREELREVALGKTERQILEMFGKPKTTSGSDGFGTWYYGNICYDKVTDKADTFTGLRFQNGVLVGISF